MSYVPPARRRYKGTMTDTDRWQKIALRPDDVFVCTPPKSGTTWTVTIVTMLALGRTDVDPQALVHWVDADVVPLNDTIDSMATQAHRRCLKTHTPFDGIPWLSEATYIAVYRHPIDMLFSLRKHLSNARNTPADHPYLGTPDECLKTFVSRAIDPDDTDFDSLATLVNHYQSYAAVPRPDNLLLLHYSDMLADARVSIERISDHMGLDRDAALIDAVQEASSFGNMKSNADRYAPFADRGYWRDPKAFFDSAGTRKWTGELSDASTRLYHDRMADLLGPSDTAWLEDGTAGQARL
jgi:aryl sulfotransferase